MDEADRMLDMGFIHDIRRIVAKLAEESADHDVLRNDAARHRQLASEMLRDPASVAVTPMATTADRIDQSVIRVDRGGEGGVLRRHLVASMAIDSHDRLHPNQAWRRQVLCGLVHAASPPKRSTATRSEGQRERALAEFRNSAIPALVATDIASRGIDVDGMSQS